MTSRCKQIHVTFPLANRLCTPGHVAAQFNRHGNCATAIVDTVVLGKCQPACVSKITVELTTLLPCSLIYE